MRSYFSIPLEFSLRTGNWRQGAPLPSNQRHYPSCQENSTYEHGEALETVLYLFDGRIFLRDAENHRGEQREYHRGREVR